MKYTDPSGHCAMNKDGSRADSDAGCWQAADEWRGTFGIGDYANVDQWNKYFAASSTITEKILRNGLYAYWSPLYTQWGIYHTIYNPPPVINPMGPQTFPLPNVTLPDCSKVDCMSLAINGTISELDNVSLYAAGGAVVAQTAAAGCGSVGLFPCAAAAEGVAGTLGNVSTAASVVGTGLTAVQVVRNKAPAKDLAVSLTSTLLGAQGRAYLGNAGASDGMAKLGGTFIGVGASLLQEQYDTK